MATRRVTTFAAACASCGARFPFPLLSDQGYGEFIAVGSAGSAYTYLSAFDEPAWDRIREITEPLMTHEDSYVEPGLRASALQMVVGKCMDPIDDQEMSIDSGPVCPKCGSKTISHWGANRGGEIDVPVASFTAFREKSREEQAVAIQRYLSEWRARARGAV
jgi:hypothetical protein